MMHRKLFWMRALAIALACLLLASCGGPGEGKAPSSIPSQDSDPQGSASSGVAAPDGTSLAFETPSGDHGVLMTAEDASGYAVLYWEERLLPGSDYTDSFLMAQFFDRQGRHLLTADCITRINRSQADEIESLELQEDALVFMFYGVNHCRIDRTINGFDIQIL